MMIGFARAGNSEESLETQRQKLEQEGCLHIFEEKDGSNFSRESQALESALNAINESDILVVTRLDKIACSIDNLAAITKQLQEQGAQLRVLDQHIDTAVSCLAFNIIDALAEFENDVKTLTKEVGSGRKPVLNERDEQEIIRLYREGSLPIDQLATKYAVSSRTVYRIIKRGLDTASGPGAGNEDAVYQQQAVSRDHPRRIYSSYG